MGTPTRAGLFYNAYSDYETTPSQFPHLFALVEDTPNIAVYQTPSFGTQREKQGVTYDRSNTNLTLD